MARRHLIKVYADTSVFGGVFDSEFSRSSRRFFRDVRANRFALVTSALVEDELVPAPARVRAVFQKMLRQSQRAEVSGDALTLRQTYIDEGIVTRASASDALHVAIATTNGCEVLVSWNCHHIVHFQKIPRYNDVNKRGGFKTIAIHTPLELAGYEIEDV